MVWLFGIDTVAHSYSYQNLGKTIAVLGCGFNNIFPKQNINLYKKILENDGLVISEYPPDTKHQSNYFLQRNRIISGLSLGILVIEAGYRSGTSVTAKLAKLQGKKVFALPHEIWDSHGIGTNKLIKNGATLVTCTNDILQEFDEFKDFKPCEITFDKLLTSDNYDNNFNETNFNCSIVSNSFDNSKKKKLENQEFKDVYDLIGSIPISINEICRKTSASVNFVSNTLFMLELNGYIKKVEGGYICILDN